MTGPAPAVAATRTAVRRILGTARAEADGGHPPAPGGPPSPVPVLVACSGGADSLALAAAAAFEAPRAGRAAGAIVVDHGLQEDSADVAQEAARACRELGLAPVGVARVHVDAGGPGGPEARARAARYAALAEAGRGRVVLLGHTRDDQAEQVLLSLLRGSGTRSLAGMPAHRPPFHRPFLGLGRATTAAACAAQGLRPWDDPHNSDGSYTRVRVRRLLGDLERDLGPGVSTALARTARLCRADADTLDDLAQSAAVGLGEPPWPAAEVRRHPPAVRARLWRRLALAAGCPAGSLGSSHLDAVDTLVADWRGQGPVHLPGARLARRIGGMVDIVAPSSY